MNGADEATRRARRLLDMVVEEVSLVDRAANQHRFLLVKRSDVMKQGTGAAEGGDNTPDAATDGAAPADTSSEDHPAGGPERMAAAVAALQSLTDAVELLGDGVEGDDAASLASLAQELRAAAQELSPEATGSDGAEPESDHPPAATTSMEVKGALATVRELLAQVRGGTHGAPSPIPTSPTPQPDSDAPMSELRSYLESLGKSLQETLQQQSQRLARLEKSFGLPNSRATDERRPGPVVDDVGWPLDLNRPFDRESVQKDSSFHDAPTRRQKG